MPSACHHCGHTSNWHRITCPHPACRLPKLRTQLRVHGLNNTSTLIDITHNETTFLDILTQYNARNGTTYAALWNHERPRAKMDNFALVTRKWVRENTEDLFVDWPGKLDAEEKAREAAWEGQRVEERKERRERGEDRSGCADADGFAQDGGQGIWLLASAVKSKGAKRFKASKSFRN